MPLIRRRLQSGLTQRIFSTLNFSADCRCAAESGKAYFADARAAGEMSGNTLIRDVLSGIELQRRWQIDAQASGEARELVGVDSYSQQEVQVSIGSDCFGGAENFGAMRADAWQANENQRLFLADRNGYTEAATTVLYDRAALTELRISAVGDTIAQSENNRSALADVAALLELFAARMTIDAFGAVENLGNRTTDSRAAAESALGVSKDQLAANEYLGQVTSDRQIALELLARLLADGRGGIEAGGAFGIITVADTRQAFIESLGSVVRDAAGQVENLAIGSFYTDTVGLVEYVRNYIDDRIWSAEARAGVGIDLPATGENAQNIRFDSFPKQENRGGLAGDVVASVEGVASAKADGIIQQEALAGMAVVAVDATELMRRVVADLLSGAEEIITGFLHVSGGATAELLASPRDRALVPAESLADLLTSLRGAIEAQSLSGVRVDSLLAMEIAGMSLVPSASLRGLIEFGQAGGDETIGQIESQGTLGFPFDPDGSVLIDGPYLVLDKTHTSISSGRIRIITVPYASLGIAVQPFDPLAANTLDVFALDFTLDAAEATIVKTSWVATFDPGSTAAVDDTPQARVLMSWPAATIYTVNPLDNSLQTWNGQFSCAAIGTCPSSAAGGTYTLSVTINLSDTRILQITSTVLCVAHQA